MYKEKIEHLLGMITDETYLKKNREIRKGILDEYKELLCQFDTFFLFGAGMDACLVLDFFSDFTKEKKIYFIDNDISKHGKEISPGISCYGKEKMFGCDPAHSIVIIASMLRRDEIYAELHPFHYADGIYQAKDKLGGTYIDKTLVELLYEDVYGAYGGIEKCEEKLGALLQTLEFYEDEKSIEVLYRFLFSKISGVPWMGDVTTFPQYYPEEIKSRLMDQESFIDCGAGQGETIEQFMDMTHENFRKIYAFEMDSQSFRTLSKSSVVKDSRVVLIPAGVSDKDKSISYYSGSGVSSYSVSAAKRSDCVAQLKSIDEMVKQGEIPERISFVKMDIEGAELDALKGMEQALKQDKPKLAICVYHKIEDLWEIPHYIKSIVPGYHMILRHHCEKWPTEMVLYAWS